MRQLFSIMFGLFCAKNNVFAGVDQKNEHIIFDHIYEEPSFSRSFYPTEKPFQEGYLQVSEIHEIFYALYGNPEGIPLVILHGGPGAGCDDTFTKFIDLSKYYVIMFDQRGANRSRPCECMEENTPAHLVEDIEKLKDHLGIEKWFVCGGSWGSTLAILYGQSYPESCKGFILRAVFLGREEDYMHLLYGMGKMAPKAYDEFLNHLSEEERADVLSSYYQRIMDPDPKISSAAREAFLRFDLNCMRVLATSEFVEKALEDTPNLYGAAKNYFYYAMNQFFLKPNQILSSMEKIQHIPAIIVHGKCDIITLPDNAYQLFKNWESSMLWMIPKAGHSPMEPELGSAVIAALDFFASREKIARD